MKTIQWEYQARILPFLDNGGIDHLNELGREGWELVAFAGSYGIFKRPKVSRRGSESGRSRGGAQRGRPKSSRSRPTRRGGGGLDEDIPF